METKEKQRLLVEADLNSDWVNSLTCGLLHWPGETPHTLLSVLQESPSGAVIRAAYDQPYAKEWLWSL